MSSHDLNPRKRIIVPGRRDNGAQVYGVVIKYAFPPDQPQTPETGHILCTIILNGEPVAGTDLGTIDQFMARLGFRAREDHGASEKEISQ